MCLHCKNLTPGGDCATESKLMQNSRRLSVADPGEALSLKLHNFFFKNWHFVLFSIIIFWNRSNEHYA